ncbi:MAG: class I SAM-dependent methyltransferase [Pseudomonadota bacterium]
MCDAAATMGHAPPNWQQYAVELWPVDVILRRRAQDIVTKSKLLDALPARGSFVDIGAGTCHLSEALLACRPGLSCLAIDTAWYPARRTGRRLAATAGDRFRHVVADGSALPLADGAMDAALIAFVLHHLVPADQLAVLREARRVLRPGGRLILLEDTPDGGRETARTVVADRRLNRESASSPHHYRTACQWVALLAGLGLRVERQVAIWRIFPPATIGAIPHHAFIFKPI